MPYPSPDLVVDVVFHGAPGAFQIDVSLGGLDPISVQVPSL